MPNNPTNIDRVRESVSAVQSAVMPAGTDERGAASATTYEQSAARAVQSVGQTTAIAIQDAADMLRNVSTIQVTAIGAATAAWISTGDPRFREIVQEAMHVIQTAVATYLTIGQNAFAVLKQFEVESTRPR